jgi:SAM-dependent methyltransferase
MMQLAGLMTGAIALGAVLLAPGLPRVPPTALTEVDQPANAGDANYTPQVGQEGKDVIWVPTPEALVSEMLKMAKVTKDDAVVDLGSGDGIIAITAAKDFGATAKGIEYNPDMVALSQRKAREAGVADKVTFVRGDIFVEDFSNADVVTMYLLPSLNLRLRPTLLAMAPGTRLTSHAFDMGEWEPDETRQADNRTAYLWIVPANVNGEWRFDAKGFSPAAGRMELRQTFQKAEGSFGPLAMSEGRLNGTAFTFLLTDAQGRQYRANADVAGASMTGSLTGPDRSIIPFTATRTTPAEPLEKPQAAPAQ